MISKQRMTKYNSNKFTKATSMCQGETQHVRDSPKSGEKGAARKREESHVRKKDTWGVRGRTKATLSPDVRGVPAWQ